MQTQFEAKENLNPTFGFVGNPSGKNELASPEEILLKIVSRSWLTKPQRAWVREHRQEVKEFVELAKSSLQDGACKVELADVAELWQRITLNDVEKRTSKQTTQPEGLIGEEVGAHSFTNALHLWGALSEYRRKYLLNLNAKHATELNPTRPRGVSLSTVRA